MAAILPFVILAARMVATRRLAAAAATRGANTVAHRAATKGVAAVNKPAMTTPVLNRVPVIGNITRQPRFTSFKPVTPVQGQRVRNLLRQANPARLRLGFQGQKMPLRTPKPIPGGGANVTARSMGGVERFARGAISPVAGAARMLSTPKAYIPLAETTLYSTAIGGIRRAANRNSGTATPYDPANYQGPSDPEPIQPRVVPTQTPTRPDGGGGAVNPVVPTSPAGAGGTGGASSIADIDNETHQQTVIEQDQRNRDELDNNLAAIASSYNSTVAEIRRLYNLSETEEEKELLRFQLADLEAQFEAGQTAVRNLYAEKTANLQLMAKQSRTEGAQSAQAMGQLYEQSATDLDALQEARRAAQTEQNRGLGIGAVSLEGDYSNLLRTMAPIAQSSAQQISDIGSQGLDFLSGLSQSMGAAREGELQSLAAARNATIRQSHMERVLDRINEDRRQMNAQIGSTLSSRASSIANAIQSFRDAGGDPTIADIYDQLAFFAEDGVPPEDLDAFLSQFFPGVTLDPSLRSQYQTWYDAFEMERDLSVRKSTGDAQAAEALAIQEQINALMLQGFSQEEALAELGLTGPNR